MKGTLKYGVIATASAVFAALPFVGVRFFQAHDSFFHLDRLVLFDHAIREGCLYPRWIQELAHGYGMPLFNYYPPFSYYFADAFHVFGLDFPEAIRATFIIGFVLSALAMFLFAKELLGEAPAVVAAIAYVYAPYHLVDGYVRGAMPEFLAFIFLPLLFYSIIKSLEGRRHYILISISYALLILTHNITAFIATPFILFYALLQKNRLRILAFLFLGLGLSTFYWLPAVAEFGFISHAASYSYAEHFVYPLQLFKKVWGFGLSVPGPDDRMSFQIGNVHLIFSILALYLLLRGEERLKRNIAYFAALLLLSIGFTLPYSKPVWDYAPFFDFIQFPWRFLFLSSFAASFLSASFIMLFKERREQLAVAALLGGMFILYSAPVLYVNPSPINELETYNYARLAEMGPKTTVGGRELLPRWAKDTSTLKRGEVRWPEGANQTGCNSYLMEGDFTGQKSLTIPIFYFPGWAVRIDAEDAAIYPDARGLISFPVHRGHHQIRIGFEDTMMRKSAKMLSILSLIILGILASRDPAGKGVLKGLWK